jgi:hypothetical protein
MYFDFLVRIPDVPGKIVRKRIKAALFFKYQHKAHFVLTPLSGQGCTMH